MFRGVLALPLSAVTDRALNGRPGTIDLVSQLLQLMLQTRESLLALCSAVLVEIRRRPTGSIGHRLQCITTRFTENYRKVE
jgi:hypothetical protein